ncbi:MAG: aminotransferase class IV [Candidatus Acidiferrales bacterium]
MIHRFVFHNHKLLPIEQVRLSPGQAGLLNGWGQFSTLRLFDGEPFAFERHWHRLQKDAARTRCPFTFDAEKVLAELRELARANHVREGCARIYAVYNTAGFWRSDESLPETDLILYTSGLPSYREPIKLGLRENGRHAASPLAGVKVTSWLNNVWNLYEAQHQGFDEVVLLNERGEVAECTAANIFAAKNGRVSTPPLVSGCLEGVTRAILLEIGSKAGVQVEERTLRPDDLYSADEVFISSTNRTLLSASEVAGHAIAHGPGPVAEKLRKAFNDYVSVYLSVHSASAARPV